MSGPLDTVLKKVKVCTGTWAWSDRCFYRLRLGT